MLKVMLQFPTCKDMVQLAFKHSELVCQYLGVLAFLYLKEHLMF